MEKLIELQLDRLYSQRESLVLTLASADANSMNYISLQAEIRNSITQIDAEINGAMSRIQQ